MIITNLQNRAKEGLPKVKTTSKTIEYGTFNTITNFIGYVSTLSEDELVFGKYKLDDYMIDSRFAVLLPPMKVTVTSDWSSIDLVDHAVDYLDKFKLFDNQSVQTMKEFDHQIKQLKEKAKTEEIPDLGEQITDILRWKAETRAAATVIGYKEISPTQFIDLQLEFFGYFKGIRPEFVKLKEKMQPVLLSTVKNVISFCSGKVAFDPESPSMPVKLQFDFCKDYVYNMSPQLVADILWEKFILPFVK